MKPQSFAVFDVELRRNEGFSVFSKQSSELIADSPRLRSGAAGSLKLFEIFSQCALWLYFDLYVNSSQEIII